MRIENGIHFYEPTDKVPLPPGLTDAASFPSKFGYKAVQKNGKFEWEAATEQDYVHLVAHVKGIKQEDVKVNPLDCLQQGPTSCSGMCFDGYGKNCALAYDPAQHYYTCICP